MRQNKLFQNQFRFSNRLIKNYGVGASMPMQKQWKVMPFSMKVVNKMLKKDTDRDGVPNQWDCQRLNPRMQDFTPVTKKQDMSAAQKFGFRNVQRLKVLGEGRDRRVYALDKNKVLKVAKNPQGIAQNVPEPDLENLYGLKHYESGKDYVVMERAEPPGQATTNMLRRLRKHGAGGWNTSGENWEAFQKAKVDTNVLNYDLAMGDFLAKRNWGEKNEQPVLIDAGTLSKEAIHSVVWNPITHTYGAKPIYRKEFEEAQRERKIYTKRNPVPAKVIHPSGKKGEVLEIRNIPPEYHGGKSLMMTVKYNRGGKDYNVYPEDVKIVNPKALEVPRQKEKYEMMDIMPSTRTSDMSRTMPSEPGTFGDFLRRKEEREHLGIEIKNKKNKIIDASVEDAMYIAGEEPPYLTKEWENRYGMNIEPAPLEAQNIDNQRRAVFSELNDKEYAKLMEIRKKELEKITFIPERNIIGTEKDNVLFVDDKEHLHSAKINKKEHWGIEAVTPTSLKSAPLEAQKEWQNESQEEKVVDRITEPDADNDNVPNEYDCEPKNPEKQEVYLGHPSDRSTAYTLGVHKYPIRKRQNIFISSWKDADKESMSSVAKTIAHEELHNVLAKDVSNEASVGLDLISVPRMYKKDSKNFNIKSHGTIVGSVEKAKEIGEKEIGREFPEFIPYQKGQRDLQEGYLTSMGVWKKPEQKKQINKSAIGITSQSKYGESPKMMMFRREQLKGLLKKKYTDADKLDVEHEYDLSLSAGENKRLMLEKAKERELEEREPTIERPQEDLPNQPVDYARELRKLEELEAPANIEANKDTFDMRNLEVVDVDLPEYMVDQETFDPNKLEKYDDKEEGK